MHLLPQYRFSAGRFGSQRCSNFGSHLVIKAVIACLLALLVSCEMQPIAIEFERLMGPIPAGSTRTFQTQSARARIDEYQVPSLQPGQPDITIRLEHLLRQIEGSIDEQLRSYELNRAEDCQSPQFSRIWSGLEASRPSTVVMLTCPKITSSELGYIRLTKAIIGRGAYVVTIVLEVPAFVGTQQRVHQEAVIFWVGQLKQFKVCTAPIDARTCNPE